MHPIQKTLIFGLVAALAACSSDSSSGGNSGGGSGPPADAGMPTDQISFTGISVADALGPEEMFLSWPDATLLPNMTGSGAFAYQVFRGTSLDDVRAQTEPIATTAPGATSYVDTNLEPFTTYFYRVTAIDPDERTSLTQRVTSGRTPSRYIADGLIDYDLEILPLWSSPSPTNPAITCLSCHTAPGVGSLDLSTREGIIRGVGTNAEPDSFLIAFNGDATWAEFQSRMSNGFVMVNHLPWFSDPVNGANIGLVDMEQPLRDFVNEGATAEPDVTPPVFAIGGVGNAGNYRGNFVDFDTIEVFFPHGSDPESLPPNGDRTGQLEYMIYAGLDTNDINWDTPVAIATVDAMTAMQDTIRWEFDWDRGGVAIVVIRPVDATGRMVPIDPLTYDPETATPQEMEEIRLRLRNMNTNEQEMVVIR